MDRDERDNERSQEKWDVLDIRLMHVNSQMEEIKARFDKLDKDRSDFRKEIEADMRALLDVIGMFKLDMAQAEGKLRTEIAIAKGEAATKIATDNGELRLQIQKDNGEFMTKLKSIGKTAAIVYAILMLILTGIITVAVNSYLHKGSP